LAQALELVVIDLRFLSSEPIASTSCGYGACVRSPPCFDGL
jgi:hypothetical protein